VQFADLVARGAALAARRRALLGLTGGPGAGKSTLALALADALRAELGQHAVAHVPMDGFHLADVALRRLGMLERKGAPETFDAAGYVALLRRLREDAGDTVYAPMFERDLEQPVAGAIAVPPEVRLVVTEGNYLLLDEGRWRDVRAVLDEVWFCDLRPDVRRERLTARHVAFGKAPAHASSWMAAVDEPNAALVEATRERADLIVPSTVLEELAPSPQWGGFTPGQPQ
jgi:pantothenate kinase